MQAVLDHLEMQMADQLRREAALVQAACRKADGRRVPDSAEANRAAAWHDLLQRLTILMNYFDVVNGLDEPEGDGY